MATGGDTTGGGGVQATGNTLTFGNVSNHSEVFLVKQQHTHHHHHVPKSVECKQLQNLIANTKQHIATHCPHGYIETKALRELKGELEKRGACLVLGLPGHGKTALALQAMGSLAASHNLKPVYLKEPKEWNWIPGEGTESQKSDSSFKDNSNDELEYNRLSQSAKFSPKVAMTDPSLPLPHSDGPDQHKHESQRYIVLLDDAFGQGHYDDAKKTAWEEVFDLMLAKVRAKQIKLIIVSRADFYETCKKSLTKRQLFDHAHKIDLMKAEYWDQKVKKAILNNFLREKSLPIDDFIDASESCTQIGFPEMCRFFAAEKEAQLQGPDFFQKPFQVLWKLLENMKARDPKMYFVLVLVFWEGGVISKKHFTSDKEILQTRIQSLSKCLKEGDSMTVTDVQDRLQDLCGVYLGKDAEENFRFAHPSIFDTLIVEMCRHDLRQVLHVCSIQQLCMYIHTKADNINQSKYIYTIDESEWPLLATRIVKALTSHELPNVIHHQSLQDPHFVRFLVKNHLSESDDLQMLRQKCPGRIDIPFVRKTLGRYRYMKPLIRTESALAALILKRIRMIPSHVLKTVSSTKLLKTDLREALLAACYVGDSRMAQELLRKRAEVNESTLSVACASDADDVPLLRKVCGKLNMNNLNSHKYQDLLWICCVKGKVNSLQYLLTEARPSDSQDVLDTVITELFRETHPSNIAHAKGLTLKGLSKLLFILKSAGATFTKDAVDARFAAGHPNPFGLNEFLPTLTISPQSQSMQSAYESLFQESAQSGSVACLELLIDSLGTSAINAVDCENRTPLHIAAFNQHVHVIQVLLKHNAETNLLDEMKRTPLHLYLFHPPKAMSQSEEDLQQTANRLQAEELLVDKTENINRMDKHGRTPLHLAVLNKNMPLVEILLKHKAIPDLPDSRGKTCLHMATENGDSFAAELCLRHEANPNLLDIDEKSALHLAVEGGDLILVDVLLEYKADINLKGCMKNSALHLAMERGDPSIVEKLLEHEADANLKDSLGRSALHLAAAYNNPTVSQMLLEHKAKTDLRDTFGQTPLHTAAMCGSIQCLQVLIAPAQTSSPDNPLNLLDMERRSPLHLYALCTPRADAQDNRKIERQRDKKLLPEELLVENTTDINRKDKDECTPLHLAVYRSKLSLMEVLLKHKANPDLQDSRKQTSLHLAAGNGNTSAMEILLKHKADTDLQDREGKSVLHVAVECSQLSLVEVLLQPKANPDLQDSTGRTPLHLAVVRDDLAQVEMLLEHEARTDIQDTSGQTPIHIAAQRGFVSCLHALTAAVAQTTLKESPLNMLDGNGCTPLLLYAPSLQMVGSKTTVRDKQRTAERLQMEELLVKNTADVNQTDKDGRVSLHLAALRGKASLVEFLLKQQADPDVQDAKGRIPLHFAAAGDVVAERQLTLPIMSVETCEQNNLRCRPKAETLLVEKTTDVNIQDDDGRTALHLAAGQGSLTLVVSLLARGAKTDLRDKEGRLALHSMAFRKPRDQGYRETRLTAETTLLGKTADLNAQDSEGLTPLHLAVQHGSLHLAISLLKREARTDLVDKRMRLPLHKMALRKFEESDDYESLEQTETLLVEKSPNLDAQGKEGKSVLHLAAADGNSLLISLLLKNKAKTDLLDNNGRCPLHAMAEINQTDKDRRVSLHLASLRGNASLAEFLPKQQADPDVQDAKGRIPLHFAAAGDVVDERQLTLPEMTVGTCEQKLRCRLKAETLLVEKTTDVNIQDDDGRTALHLAAGQGSLTLVVSLLARGTKTDLRDKKGRLALHLMAFRKPRDQGYRETRLTAETTLLGKTADLNAQDSEGLTPLHLAVQHGSLHLAISLLKREARRDLVDIRRHVPLHKMAIRKFHTVDDYLLRRQTETLLVEKSVDLCVQDENKKTALHLAAEHASVHLMSLLVEHKARTDLLDYKGRCPLHAMAASDKYRRLRPTLQITALTVLHDLSADVNLQDIKGRTPLHMAAGQGSLTLVVPLLARGARTDLADKEGRLPLHCMAARTLESLEDQERTDEAMTELMERTLDVNTEDNNRCTALQLAVDQENWSLVKLLLKHGAEPDLLDEKSLSLLKSQTFATKKLLHEDHRRGLIMEDVGSSVC